MDPARCLLCTCDRYVTGRDGVLRTCSNCSFAWTAQVAAPSADLYDETYFSGGGYEDYFQPSARRFEAMRRVRWLCSFSAPATLVEAGSAGGFFVEAARQAGIDANGFELSDVAAAYARDTLKVPVRTASFEAAAVTASVQAVCAFHVLEHVEDPRTFLDAARRALQPGGVLALEVPNIESGAARRLGTRWQALQPEFHRWHFSPTTLRQLLAERGFEVVCQDTTAFRYYMPPRFRRRQARHLFLADVRDLRSIRLTHPTRGDLLRVIARVLPDARIA